MTGRAKQRDGERELSKHPTSFGIPLTVCAIIMVVFPPLQLLDNSNHDGLLFAVSSMLYLLLDPLFLYAPLINENTKCLVLDNRVKIAALFFRSLGDVRYLIRIYLLIKEGWGKSPSRRKMLRLASDTVSILPIPQVAILIFLPKMRGSNSLKTMTFLNSLIASQYFPRIYPIFVLFKEINTERIDDRRDRIPKWSSIVVNNPKWSSIVVNMFGYIIASHMFGAFWYFFSIQREIECWGHACRIENGCEFSTSCVQNTYRNLTLLENSCPTNPPNKQVFDFGVFHDALQSGMQKSTNFPQKFLQCLSWGIRNMSSFGSNLSATSANGGENLLVVLFSIFGLVLFMYLLGHAQTFMQKVSKSDTILQKMEMTIEPKIRSILSEYGLSNGMERKINLAVKQNLKEDENYIVENMFSILSLKEAKNFAVEIKCTLFLDKLKKVEGLKHKDDLVLKKICEHLKPVIYSESSYIIREGEPLDLMFFLTQGIVLIYNSCGSSRTVQAEKEKSGLYGKELLIWAEESSTHLSTLPFSTATIKSHNKVEVFTIKATDLQLVVSQNRLNVDGTLTEIHSC
ncbi:cyclic nucleotide-gated ion channel 1-like [Rosa sericea]